MSIEQDEEIKTIKERSITLKLSDADIDRLYEKAGGVGLTVSELLENFIGDLVDGTYSNGSDERMYANEWFDRCWFGMGLSEMSFLQWLIMIDSVEEVVSLWVDRQSSIDDLQEFHAGHDKIDEDDKEVEDEYKEDIATFERELSNYFDDYMQQKREVKTSNLDAEMEKVMQWYNEKSKLKAGPPKADKYIIK